MAGRKWGKKPLDGATATAFRGAWGISVGQEHHRRRPAACPRCGKAVREPTAWSSDLDLPFGAPSPRLPAR
jgi:hypothetical protein